MKTFTDNAGRVWQLALNVQAMRQVRDLAKVDLAGSDLGKTIEQIAADPILLCDVIYSICYEEAKAKGVTSEEFGKAMAGDVIEVATTALLEELVNFTRSPQRRALVAKAVEKRNRLEEMLLQVAEQKLNDPELEEKLKEEMQKILDGNSSGSLPELQE